MDEDDELDVEEVSAYPWSWWRPLVVLLAFVSEVLGAATTAATHLTTITAAAHNHKQDQEDFRAAVVHDIESLAAKEE